jgi:hypothetical protein
MAALESELSQAQRYIDQARVSVARQRKTIAELKADGYDTKAAESLLKTMLTTLRAFEDDRLRLEDERFRAF